jgi:hypothetical protein
MTTKVWLMEPNLFTALFQTKKIEYVGNLPYFEGKRVFIDSRVKGMMEVDSDYFTKKEGISDWK